MYKFWIAGNTVDKNVYNREGGTLDLKNVKLIRLKDPKPGDWQVDTLPFLINSTLI